VNGRAIEDYKRYDVLETGLAVPRAEPLYRPAISNGIPVDDFVIDDSLVLYLPLYALKGSKFKSVDRNGYTCTAVGALWQPYGRLFDGSDDRITFATNITKGLTGLTILAWIKPTDVSSTQAILADYTSGNDASAVMEISDVAGTSTYRISFSAKGEDVPLVTCSGSITSRAYGSWTMVGGTWDNLVLRAYGNGVYDGVVALIADTLESTVTENTCIGELKAGGAEDYSGGLGELWIYSRGFSAAEMLRSYSATVWRYQ